MILLFLLAAAQASAFSCTVDPPRALSIKGDNVTSHAIALQPPISQSKFDLTLRRSEDRIKVSLVWPGDPIDIGQAGSAIPEGPHDYAFVSMHPGPCMFTVTSCITMITLSEQPDGSAKLLLQPSALGTEGDRSEPSAVFLTGRCTPKGRA